MYLPNELFILQVLDSYSSASKVGPEQIFQIQTVIFMSILYLMHIIEKNIIVIQIMGSF
jgi:hypothetical protein